MAMLQTGIFHIHLDSCCHCSSWTEWKNQSHCILWFIDPTDFKQTGQPSIDVRFRINWVVTIKQVINSASMKISLPIKQGKLNAPLS